MKKQQQIKLTAWDIWGTLISQEIVDANLDRIARDNALALLMKDPFIPLNVGVEETLQKYKGLSVPQGIISSCSYPFGTNFIAASKARDYIDHRLTFLGHKYAWEGMILDKRDYDKVLEEYVKPSIKMFELARDSYQDLYKQEIRPDECLYFGDNNTDREAATKAGWKFKHITELR